MSQVEYKDKDYYLKKNPYPSKNKGYTSIASGLKGTNLNYDTLNKQNNNNVDTPYSIPKPPPAPVTTTPVTTSVLINKTSSNTAQPNTTQSVASAFGVPTASLTNTLLGSSNTLLGSSASSSFGTTGFRSTGTTGFTASSSFGTTGFRSTGTTGFTASSGFGNTTSNFSVSGTQCSQLPNYSSSNGVSNSTIFAGSCPAPIELSTDSLFNSNLASIDANGNISYKNLPTNSITTSINLNTGFTGYTGSSKTLGSSGFTGFTAGTIIAAAKEASKTDAKNIAAALSSTLSQCNEPNQTCYYESYEGITSIKSLQELVNKQTAISKPQVPFQWVGADKSFNVGYDQIPVAVLYSYSTSVPTGTSFTLFATNRGYVFVNDKMYVINNNIGSNLNVLANIPVPSNKSGPKTEINVLLPGNSAILINNNTLFNTSTKWSSKTYDLKNSVLPFAQLDPLDFVKEELKKAVISKKQNVYIIKDLTVPINVTIDTSSALISNSSTYKSYSDKDLDPKNNDLSIKSVVYSPIEDLHVNGSNSSVSFAVYSSNNFDVYFTSNNELIKLTNSPIFNKITVNSSITLKSLSLTYKLPKGVNHLYVVAPENTLIYIPYFKIDNINDVFSNKDLSKSTDYTDVNKINITTQFWKYVFVNIPYIQFDYKSLNANINAKFLINETYVNYNNNNYKRIDNMNNLKNKKKNSSQKSQNILSNIIPSSIKDMFSIFTSNGYEHYTGSTGTTGSENLYNELEAKVIKHDYIVNSEKVRAQIQNVMDGLNSDAQYDLVKIKQNNDNLLNTYNTYINDINTKTSNVTIKNNYNLVVNSTNDGYLKRLKEIVDGEAKNSVKTTYNNFVNILSTYTKYYDSVVTNYNTINSNSSSLKTSITNAYNADKKSLDDIYAQLSAQYTKLKTAVASGKYDDVKKEYDTYQVINKSMQEKIPIIQKSQSDFSKSVANLDTPIKDLTTATNDFTKYLNTVISEINNYTKNSENIKKIDTVLSSGSTLVNPLVDLQKIINSTPVTCKTSNDICTFIVSVDNLNAQYYLAYTEPLTGIKIKILKYIELNNTINTLLTTNFNKAFPDLSSEIDIQNYINSLNVSSIWNGPEGLNAINNFKNALKTYLTSYFKVLSKINSTFGIKVTKMDNALITTIGGTDDKGGIILQNSLKIKAYGTTKKSAFEKNVNDANTQYSLMTDLGNKMKSSSTLLTDANMSTMNAYLEKIKTYNTNVINDTKTYTTDIESIKSLYLNPINDCSNTFNVSDSSSTSDIFNSKAVVEKLAIMLNYQRAWSTTSVNDNNIESFNNYEHLSNNLLINSAENGIRLNNCVAVTSGISSTLLSSYEVTSGIWCDSNSAIQSLDKMEGTISFITTFNSTIAINNVKAKIFVPNTSFKLYVNDMNIGIGTDNLYTFNIPAKQSMIKISVDLSSSVTTKVKSRFLLFSAKGSSGTTTITINTNNPLNWKYIYEYNRYRKHIPITGNNTSTCDSICLSKNHLCNNASVGSTVYNCNTLIKSGTVNCNCIPISPNEAFTNYNEHYTSTPKLSSYYGGTNTKPNNIDLIPKDYSGTSSILTNKNQVNSILLHKAPYKGDTYLTGMTMIDTNNNMYPVGTAYQDDVTSKLYSCKSGFSGVKTNETKVNNQNVIYNAALQCNEPIYEQDNIPYMNLIKNKSKNIVYNKAENIRYPGNTIFEDQNMKFEDCPKKCNETPGCIGYGAEKLRNECAKVEKCEEKGNMKKNDCMAQGAKDIWDCNSGCRRGFLGKKYDCDEDCKCKFCKTVDECKDVPRSTGCTFKTKFANSTKENTPYFDTYYINPSNNNPESTTLPTPFDNNNYFEYQS